MITDITYYYFNPPPLDIPIIYKNIINYNQEYQFKNFIELNLFDIIPFVNKYFSPSDNIKDIKDIKDIKETIKNKYNINTNNACVLFLQRK